MYVRVELQLACPGMQHRGDAGHGARGTTTTRATGEFEQRFGRRAQQQAVQRLGKGTDQSSKLARQREHDVEVSDGKDLGDPLLHPLLLLEHLTLRTVPVATGAVLGLLEAAVGAAVQKAA